MKFLFSPFLLLIFSDMFSNQKENEDVVALLQNLIRIKTINSDPKEGEDFVKGNELELVNYVKEYLSKNGIDSQVIKSDSKRASLIARLQAQKPEGKAVALMAHIDVVGVDKNYWTADPFAAAIKDDGYMYGRGTIDDKGMAACAIQAFIKLKKAGFQLKRDLVLLLSADEEAGGHFGIKYLTKNHPDMFKDTEFVINEGGHIIEKDEKLFVYVQGAEKSLYNVLLKVKGESGHSSVPHNKNPIETLSKAIARVSEFRDAPVLLDIIRAHIEAKLPHVAEKSIKQIFSDILNATSKEELTELTDKLLSLGYRDGFLYNALLRNTATTTIFNSGVRFNVIPPVAQATVNVRILPGDKIEKFVERLTKHVNMNEVEFEIEKNIDLNAPATPFDTPCYEAIVNASKTTWGDDVAIIPHMSTGGTDSKALRAIGIHCYGILPFPMTDEDLARMHGNDERVKVEHLKKGVDFLYNIALSLNK